MLYQQGAHNGSNMGSRMHSYPIYQDFQKRAEPLAEVLCPAADGGLGQRRQPDRAASTPKWSRATTSRCSACTPAHRPRVQLAGRRSGLQGHPVVVLSYDYWVRRFARDPTSSARRSCVNNYPMTIVGVSAAGFAGLDPARSPQIRVPILMKPVVVPEWGWVHMDDPRARAGCRCSRASSPATPRSRREAPLQGLFTQIRAVRDDAARRQGLVELRARAVHEGPSARGARRHRLLEPAQRLLDRAGRADVHGRPGAADRLRQRREPAHRARLHAPEGDRRPAVARRRRAASSCGRCWSRACCCRSSAASLGIVLAIGADPRR